MHRTEDATGVVSLAISFYSPSGEAERADQGDGSEVSTEIEPVQLKVREHNLRPGRNHVQRPRQMYATDESGFRKPPSGTR